MRCPPRRVLAARRLTALPLLALALALGGGCGGDDEKKGASTGTTSGGPTVEEVMADLPASCAFTCGACDEPATPYACPTMGKWDEIPHDDACGDWDGTYPAPVKGQCVASDATGEAARKAGPIPGGLVLPDGHRILPAGREVVFDEADLPGGFPMSLFPIPGSSFALATDGGIQSNALRLIDVDALASGGKPVASYVAFPSPSSIFYGIALLPNGRVLASGGGDGMVYAFDVDTTAGTLTRAPDHDVHVAVLSDDPYYVGPIAVTGDGQRLVVAPDESAKEIRIFSLADADYGKTLATISLGKSKAIFDLRTDPFDPTGNTMYASDETGSRLLAIDAAAGKVTQTVALEKNPSQIVFLDATYAVVAESDSDSLAVVDRLAGTVEARVPVFEPDAPRGFSPAALTWDAPRKRLYATLAGVNAVEAYDVTLGTPPTIQPAGRLPTAWWPTAVTATDDGSLVILNGKGHGTGTDGKYYPWSEGPITSRMRGSVEWVPASDLVDLSASTKIVDQTRDLGGSEGAPAITCPDGVFDFPIPKDTKSGPSKQIDHVILVVRENKTYDALFGDDPTLGDGDPSLIMASDSELQSKIWQNARKIAKSFTNFDNFYTDAEQSMQGHVWTVYGRTTDYFERSWLTAWGRGTRPILLPTSRESMPEERGIFDWMSKNGIDSDDMGEGVGVGPNGLDTRYPGTIQAIGLPDVNKSCYVAGRIRLQCDLKPFTYATQPNDHTNGGSAGAPAPEVMIALNDEASGMLLDALSHSPIWKSSLVIITEDDPQDGGDHVDLHRSILLMASPWVRRGYVSHGHYDMASVYKLVAHIFGVDYHNEAIRQALLPLDAFTSTPDYTPYDYLPRVVDAPCNPAGTKQAEEAEGWDFGDVDDQPGLSQQIMRMMKEPRGSRGVRILSPRR